MNNAQLNDMQAQINRLQSEISQLSAEYYKNNFKSTQAFNKASSFTTSLMVPVYTTLPSCEVGQICVYGGKLYVASATNTWTIVGTQTA